MIKNFFKVKISILLIFCWGITSSFTHKYYASLAQMMYNPTTRSIECTLTLFIDDVENYLSHQLKRRITLESKEFKTELHQLLKREFQIKNNKGEFLTLEWIGLESSVQTCTAYIEFINIKTNKPYYIQNILMIPYFETQQNLVNIDFFSQKRSFLFKKGTTQPQQLIIIEK